MVFWLGMIASPCGPRFFMRTERWLVNGKTCGHQVAFLVAGLLFRAIYLPQSTRWPGIRLPASNAPTIARLVLRRLFLDAAAEEAWNGRKLTVERSVLQDPSS